VNTIHEDRIKEIKNIPFYFHKLQYIA
jgi:hypothetical protein